MKNVFIAVFVLIFLITLIFLVWYLFFNIYEVKFITNVEGSNLKPNSEIIIKYYGINSFGKKLTFRKISMNFKFLEGNELIKKIDSSNQNQVSLFTKSDSGIVKIQLDSKYSLNPSIFTFTINN